MVGSRQAGTEQRAAQATTSKRAPGRRGNAAPATSLAHAQSRHATERAPQAQRYPRQMTRAARQPEPNSPAFTPSANACHSATHAAQAAPSPSAPLFTLAGA